MMDLILIILFIGSISFLTIKIHEFHKSYKIMVVPRNIKVLKQHKKINNGPDLMGLATKWGPIVAPLFNMGVRMAMNPPNRNTNVRREPNTNTDKGKEIVLKQTKEIVETGGLNSNITVADYLYIYNNLNQLKSEIRKINSKLADICDLYIKDSEASVLNKENLVKIYQDVIYLTFGKDEKKMDNIIDNICKLSNDDKKRYVDFVKYYNQYARVQIYNKVLDQVKVEQNENKDNQDLNNTVNQLKNLINKDNISEILSHVMSGNGNGINVTDLVNQLINNNEVNNEVNKDDMD